MLVEMRRTINLVVQGRTLGEENTSARWYSFARCRFDEYSDEEVRRAANVIGQQAHPLADERRWGITCSFTLPSHVIENALSLALADLRERHQIEILYGEEISRAVDRIVSKVSAANV